MAKTVLIVFLFLTFWVKNCDAAVLSSQFVANEVKKSVIEQLSAKIKGQIFAEINETPFKSINIPEGKVFIRSSLNTNYFCPSSMVKVEVIVDGKKVKSFSIPVKLSVYDNVWVARDTVNRGESFSNANLGIEKKELGLSAEHAARYNLAIVGAISKKNYKPGDIIDTRYIESQPVVMKNSPVSVIFKSQEIVITISAQSLDNGKEGDYVRVRSKEYKKDYVGKVMGFNTVLVII